MQNSEKSVLALQKDNIKLQKDNEKYTEDNILLKQDVKALQDQIKTQVQAETHKGVKEENEVLKTKLAEVRSAMLSYKGMCTVIADQVKSLKLVHERKKDEHDNLLNALREMQTENTHIIFPFLSYTVS